MNLLDDLLRGLQNQGLHGFRNVRILGSKLALFWEALGAIWRPYEGPLGSFGHHLGSIWGHFGSFLELLGVVMAPFGRKGGSR